MKKSTVLFLLLSMACPAFTQFKIKAQAGLSYTEHLSTGMTFNFGEKHAVSVLCGSNLFIQLPKFSNYFLQYEYAIPRWKIAGAIPKIGVKGGDSYFTDEYYRWHVVNVIPFMGARYPFNDRVDFLFEAGMAVSFVQSVKRIKPGELGYYRHYLPEVKAGICYTLFSK